MEKEPLPQNLRKPSMEERFGQAALKPEEKMGYYKHDLVVVDTGPDYQKRLKELKTISQELNLKLQAKLEQADLPVTTLKKNNTILRITFQIRPPFVSTEEDKQNKRFMPAKDEVVMFWHLNNDNSYNGFRTAGQPGQHSLLYAYAFNPEFNPDDEKRQLKQDIENLDTDKLADYIIKNLKKNSFIKFFQQVKNIKNLQEANIYFNQEQIYTVPNAIVQNLLKSACVNILKHELSEKIKSTDIIPDLIEQFLRIPIKNIDGEKSAGEILRAELDANKFQSLIGSLAKQANDDFKREKFSKKKI